MRVPNILRSQFLLALLWVPCLVPAVHGQSFETSLAEAQAEAGEGDSTPDSNLGVQDPWENMNRGIFAVNEAADIHLVTPVARGWRFVIPDFGRTAIHNVNQVLPMPAVFANNLIQLEPHRAGQDLARVVVNVSLGLAGLIDVATRLGIPQNDEDFGQSLGFWGVPTGPYLVLPLFGPSNIRDAVGRLGDGAGTFYLTWVPIWVSFLIQGVDLVNWRSFYIEDVESMRSESLDYYVFMRDAYMQLRQKRVDRALGITTEEARSDDLYYFDDEDDEEADGYWEEETSEGPMPEHESGKTGQGVGDPNRESEGDGR